MPTPTHAPRTVKRKKSQLRQGILSHREKELCENWFPIKSTAEIARALNRSLKSIEKYKKEFMSGAPPITVERSEAEELRRELQAHPSWLSIQEQFTNVELLFYENNYIGYRKQFSDMTATELKQMEQLITLEIFMHRHNVDRMDHLEEIDRVNKLLKKEYEKPGDKSREELQNIQQLETIIQSSRASAVSRTKEYQVLLEKHGAILKDLKGTRAERIKNLEDRGKFMTILKELEVAERKRGVEEISGLMDLAVDKEAKRLAKPFKYADGFLDQPLLNYETYREIKDDEFEDEIVENNLDVEEEN